MNRLFPSGHLVLPLLLTVCTTTLAQDPPWPDPVAQHVVPALTAGLTHGPMLGRPSANSVRVWVRTEKPMAFEIRYATELPLDAGSPSVKGRTEAARDNIGVVDLKALAPHQTYYYGVVLNGKLADTRVAFRDPWPSFRTLPDRSTNHDPANNPDGRFNLCFSVSVCASQDPKTSGENRKRHVRSPSQKSGISQLEPLGPANRAVAPSCV